MTYFIIFGAMLAAVGIGAGIGIALETRNWNKGICRNCGNKLYFFDYDHTGGRGYECKHCHHKVWISYNCVDRKRRR